MIITYLANFNSKERSIEQDIKIELEKLGHKVIAIDDVDFKIEEVAKIANQSDLFLFRTGGVSTNSIPEFQKTLNRLQTLLSLIKTKRVFWFFDKVIGLGKEWIYTIEPLVDFGFLNDETFLRRHHVDKLFPLHMGIRKENAFLGNFNEKYACDVAFEGPIYEQRKPLIDMLNQTFGAKFKTFRITDEKEYADFCASAKIIVSSRFPYDDFFWSEKIYKTLGHGGFAVFPRLEGLKEEGIEDGFQFSGYDVYGEMIEVIKWWLNQENKKAVEGYPVIKQQGTKTVVENFTYDKRLRELLEISFGIHK